MRGEKTLPSKALADAAPWSPARFLRFCGLFPFADLKSMQEVIEADCKRELGKLP
jgi:hypothetical protein